MDELRRIVVVTSNPNYSVRRNIVAIDRALPGLAWLILIERPQRQLRRMARVQWRNLRIHGWRRIPAVAAIIAERLRERWSNPPPDEAPGFEYSWRHLAAMPNVQIRVVRDLHSPETIRTVTEFRPDLGLTLCAPIVKPCLFTLPRLGTLNLHKGKLPEYRGMIPAFWELWNDEPAVGCTAHWVEKGLDTGPIVAATSIDCEPYATVKGLQLRLDEVGIELMLDAVTSIARGTYTSTPQRPGGTTYPQPTLAEEQQLERRLSRQLPHRTPQSRRLVKELVHKPAWTAGALAHRAIRTPRVTVLLYHRVTDSTRDDLTVGIEQFDRQMALLRRHFRVLSLPDLLAMESVPRSTRPLVCVTFDDGYLDNYTNAFPILVRNRIPAAFFVSTGLIGTQRQFPHDVRRGNPPIPLMDWDHLRAMQAEGFVIGAHTVNHIDCATEPEEIVAGELEQSRDTIRHELGLHEVVFAYPYGGREHMTPERLELVRQMGYSGCMSAYGGCSVGTIDRFNVPRRGVHWEYSDAAFLNTASALSGVRRHQPLAAGTSPSPFARGHNTRA